LKTDSQESVFLLAAYGLIHHGVGVFGKALTLLLLLLLTLILTFVLLFPQV
jgi:hypothetical protein